MKNIYNILILLSIIIFSVANKAPCQSQRQIVPSVPAIKGPVYNPLRVRPYSKNTVKV